MDQGTATVEAVAALNRSLSLPAHALAEAVAALLRGAAALVEVLERIEGLREN